MFLESFLEAFFITLALGVVLNYGVAAFFFIRLKKNYGGSEWGMFKVPSYLLLLALSVGSLLLFI